MSKIIKKKLWLNFSLITYSLGAAENHKHIDFVLNTLVEQIRINWTAHLTSMNAVILLQGKPHQSSCVTVNIRLKDLLYFYKKVIVMVHG